MIVPMGWTCFVLDLVIGPVSLVVIVLFFVPPAPLEVFTGFVVDGTPSSDWMSSSS